MRIAVIGHSGQLARALQSPLRTQDLQVECFGRNDLDLATNPEVVRTFTENLDCDGIIIAAAYTAVDKAEDEEELALSVNAVSPGIISEVCAERGLPLVHVSTDYVFQGRATTPYQTDAPIDPQNAYGRTKALGESAVLRPGTNAAVLRTSWVFDGSGKNFMTTMLRLGSDRDALNVVGDQIGRPTYAGHLADACLTALKGLKAAPGGEKAGVYHTTGAGEPVSWAEFADTIFARAEADLGKRVEVTAIPSSEYPTPAKRPAYSVLDLSAFEQAFETTLQPWSDGLNEALEVWRVERGMS